METDKKAASSFTTVGYITERLEGSGNRIGFGVPCITLNGEERWVRNVLSTWRNRGSEYAMIFLRDITEAKVECTAYAEGAG